MLKQLDATRMIKLLIVRDLVLIRGHVSEFVIYGNLN